MRAGSFAAGGPGYPTNKTISASKQATKDENNRLTVARPKAENPIRLISIP